MMGGGVGAPKCLNHSSPTPQQQKHSGHKGELQPPGVHPGARQPLPPLALPPPGRGPDFPKRTLLIISLGVLRGRHFLVTGWAAAYGSSQGLPEARVGGWGATSAPGGPHSACRAAGGVCRTLPGGGGRGGEEEREPESTGNSIARAPCMGTGREMFLDGAAQAHTGGDAESQSGGRKTVGAGNRVVCLLGRGWGETVPTAPPTPPLPPPLCFEDTCPPATRSGRRTH